MINHLLLAELSNARHQDLIAEAARERLANQIARNQPTLRVSLVAVVHQQIVRLLRPVGLTARRSA